VTFRLQDTTLFAVKEHKEAQMSLQDFPQNLRLLCSYGKSASDICRRIGLNRQQFNKYLNGQSRPSLSTLRRICDFFGVDEAEVLLDHHSFAKLVRLRPPVQARTFDPLASRLERRDRLEPLLLERHAGYYYIYMRPDPGRNYILRSMGHVFKQGRDWFSKEIERYKKGDFAVPSTLKHLGLVYEAHKRLVITSREQGRGMSMWSTMLITSDYDEPKFLPGLIMGIEPEGAHSIYGTRVVWEYLGKAPDLRAALRGCGARRSDSADIPEFVRNAGLGEDGSAQNWLTAFF
jgi:transcriptional regulator with XRE-family HTH domain